MLVIVFVFRKLIYSYSNVYLLSSEIYIYSVFCENPNKPTFKNLNLTHKKHLRMNLIHTYRHTRTKKRVTLTEKRKLWTICPNARLWRKMERRESYAPFWNNPT